MKKTRRRPQNLTYRLYCNAAKVGQSQATGTESSKFERKVFEIWWQADPPADRQIDRE